MKEINHFIDSKFQFYFGKFLIESNHPESKTIITRLQIWINRKREDKAFHFDFISISIIPIHDSVLLILDLNFDPIQTYISDLYR